MTKSTKCGKKYPHGKEWSYSKNKKSSEKCMQNCTTWEHAKVQILNLTKIRVTLSRTTNVHLAMASYQYRQLCELLTILFWQRINFQPQPRKALHNVRPLLFGSWAPKRLMSQLFVFLVSLLI